MEKRYLKCSELSKKRTAEIIAMLNNIWPPKDKLSEEQYSERYLTKNGDHDLILYLVHGKIVAHAISFARKINSDFGFMEVLALAGIAVHQEYRGQNLGKNIVLDAFRNLAENDIELSLFQTGVPSFYKKLGAKTVNNKFVNSLNKDDPRSSPWWDKEIMIYPGSAKFPEGVIDLLGTGY